LVGWSEIDRYAIQAHNLIYPQWAGRNYGDISKIDFGGVEDFDLFTMSSPCTDFSNAGKQMGGEEGSGTRSSLLWECRKAVAIKRPKYIVFENVKALVSDKFIKGFTKWQRELEDFGYCNYWQVLNAKDYGVPQNRERVFMVSVRKDIDCGYEFPKKQVLTKRLKDVLEENVEEKYYLSDKLVKSLSRDNGGYRGMIPKNIKGVACTLTARYAKMGRSDNYVADEPICLNPKVDGEQPSLQNRVYSVDGIYTCLTTSFLPSVLQIGNIVDDTDRNFKNPQTGRVYSDEGLSPTLNTMQGGGREPKILLNNKTTNDEKTGVFSKDNEASTREILLVLQHQVGKEAFEWAIGGLWGIFKEEVLRQGLYEKELCGEREQESTLLPSTLVFKGNDVQDSKEGYDVRELWKNKECRCSPQGLQLSEQFTEQFDALVSKLSYENPQNKICLQYMWKCCESAQSLQQTLYTLEEIRKSIQSVQQNRYRIRKLTCREVFRLMDVSDEDFDKLQGISNSQLYKLAGNSIVVACLEGVFRKLLIEKASVKQQTLF
jgi:DNA (cytosine-5)-methyltransferase 1